MNYTITKNDAFNSIEISFDSKPSEAVREALKGLRFRWHGVKKVWYGYSTEEAVRAALGETTEKKTTTKANAPRKAEKVNKYGVKVGDLFECTWGWEQTNVDFFQVVELVGECSVRVREVYLEIVADEAVGPMSANRTYELTNELLAPVPRSVFIEDQERGDIKRLRPGYDSDPEEAKKHCAFKVSSFASAYKCNGDTVKTYESWYA